MSLWALWVCMILLIGTGIAADVPFVFDEKSSNVSSYTADKIKTISNTSSDLAGVPFTSTPSGNDILKFPITGGGDTPPRTTGKKADDLKKLLSSKVEADNPAVIGESVSAAGMYSGDYTIEQVSAIYDYLKENWHYFRDPRGLDYFKNASESLMQGKKSGCVGVGDCDDFSILMSALVEASGGTTRIILARNNATGGHAYAEVYLGQLNATNNHVEDIINWLHHEYETGKIYTHIDTDTEDVWLNLDWGPDEIGSAHPGGPFYPGDTHYIICIRDTYGKTPLKLPEKLNKPPMLINLIPDKADPQDAGTSIAWTANARDFDKDQILYRFFINDEPATNWSNDNKWTWPTTDADIGKNQVEVRIRDGKHRGPNRFDDNEIIRFNVTVPNLKHTAPANQPPVITNFISDKTSPQNEGITITWTVKASDPENDPVVYRFLHKGKTVSEWSSANSWTWTTTSDDIGEDQIEAQVRDGKHAGSDGFDSRKTASFTINVPEPAPVVVEVVTNKLNDKPVISELATDKASPQETGSIVTWTVKASDAENDPISYRFLLNGIPLTDWQSSNQWTWTATNTNVGDNKIEVRVRDENHAGFDSFDDRKIASYVIKAKARDSALTTSFESPTIRQFKPIKTLNMSLIEGKELGVLCLAFSPDSKTLAAGSNDWRDTPIVKLWNVWTGEELYALQGHANYIYSVAFSPDGKLLASGSDDYYNGTMKIWNIDTGKEIMTFKSEDGISSIAFSPDNKIISATLTNFTASSKFWLVSAGQEFRPYGDLKISGNHVAFSPNGKIVATSGFNDDLTLWDVQTWQSLRILKGHIHPVTCIVFSPDGSMLASSSEDGTVKIWSVETGKEMRNISVYESVYNVAFSPDGKTLASDCNDKIKLWNAATGEELQSLSGLDRFPRVAFSPDGNFLAVGYGGEPIIQLWDLKDILGSKPSPLRKPEVQVNWQPSINSFVPDKSSPQVTGTSVSWTAEAIDPDGDPIRYKYFINGNPMTDWIKDPTWTWQTGHFDVGDNRLEVRIRDGQHLNPNSFDCAKSAQFTVSSGISTISQWEKKFGGSEEDKSNSIEQTNDGGYIIAGYTYSYGAGSEDAWLIKTDSSGNELWNKTFGGQIVDEGYSVRQTSDGGYILAGETCSFAAGWYDAWLIKTDPLGNELWNRTFGGSGADHAFSVEQTKDGGYIITGCTGPDSGKYSIWLIKTNANGNKSWDKTFGENDLNIGYSVKQTKEGGYIIAGSTNGESDAWLIKTYANGNEEWNNTFRGYGDSRSVQQTSDGGYIIIADYKLFKTDGKGIEQWNKTMSFGRSIQQTKDSGYIIAGGTTEGAELLKTNSNGDKIWAKTTGAGGDSFNSVQQTDDGGYIAAGYTSDKDVWLMKLKW